MTEKEKKYLADILQSIIDLYYPNGEPTGNGNADVCCTLDTMHINLDDEEVTVTGGVQPYEISIDTTGNVVMVTVVDYDGCESTTEYILSSLSEEYPKGIKIYPNPASTEIYIDLTGSNHQITNWRIVSMNGQVLHQSRIADHIDISTLVEGVYILQIEFAGGDQISKRVLILR